MAAKKKKRKAPKKRKTKAEREAEAADAVAPEEPEEDLMEDGDLEPEDEIATGPPPGEDLHEEPDPEEDAEAEAAAREAERKAARKAADKASKAARKEAIARTSDREHSTLKPIRVKRKPAKDLKEYWLGTLADCPVQNATLGGVTFPRYTEKVTHPKGKLVTQRTPRRGAIRRLTQQQYNKVLEAAQSKVVRMSARPVVLSSRNKHYQTSDLDVPMGCFVFCHDVQEVHEALGAHWFESEPQPMISRDDYSDDE